MDNLESAVKRLKCKPFDSEWGDYYENSNYSSEAMNDKKQVVADFLDQHQPKTVWDIGANLGVFSRLSAEREMQTIGA